VSFELARAARDVLLGDDPPVALTRRATAAVAAVRDDLDFSVHPGGTVISRSPSGDLRWWTWAGDRTNATLQATLGDLADQSQRIDPSHVRLRGDLRPDGWRSAVAALADHLVLPEVDGRAVHGLKFSAALPRHLAEATLAVRLADLEHAAQVLGETHRFLTSSR
jgi:ATP-dependent Lhr-like helicase